MHIRTILTAFGMSGTVFHGPLLSAHPGFDWVGVVRRSQRESPAAFPHIPVFPDLKTALEQTTPDLVVVNTPPSCHEAEIELALRQGCHVVVEKPFVTEADTARNLLDLASSLDRLLVTFQNRRWDSDFLGLKEFVETRAGTLYGLDLHFDRFRPEIDPGSWKEEAEVGSGLVWNLGSHLVDQAVCLLGPPDSVLASVRKERPGTRVDDAFWIELAYPTFSVNLRASYRVPAPRLKYRVLCEAGQWIKNGMDPQEAQLKSGLSPLDAGYGIEPEPFGSARLYRNDAMEPEPLPSPQGNYLEFYNQLALAIDKKEAPPVPAADMLLNTRILVAAYQSAREGRRILL